MAGKRKPKPRAKPSKPPAPAKPSEGTFSGGPQLVPAEPQPEPIILTKRQQAIIEARVAPDAPEVEEAIIVKRGGTVAPRGVSRPQEPVEEAAPAPETPPEPLADRLQTIMAALPELARAGALTTLQTLLEEVVELQKQHDALISKTQKVAVLWKADRDELLRQKQLLKDAQDFIAQARAAVERGQTPVLDLAISTIRTAATKALERGLDDAVAQLRAGLVEALTESDDDEDVIGDDESKAK